MVPQTEVSRDTHKDLKRHRDKIENYFTKKIPPRPTQFVYKLFINESTVDLNRFQCFHEPTGPKFFCDLITTSRTRDLSVSPDKRKGKITDSRHTRDSESQE